MTETSLSAHYTTPTYVQWESCASKDVEVKMRGLLLQEFAGYYQEGYKDEAEDLCLRFPGVTYQLSPEFLTLSSGSSSRMPFMYCFVGKH